MEKNNNLKKINLLAVSTAKNTNSILKEIIRQNSFDFFHTDGFVFSVFRPFAELSYQQADKEVCMAVDSIFGSLNKTNGN